MRTTKRLNNIPTASGGITRAACAFAARARVPVGALLKRANLTLRQAKNAQMRIAVKDQIEFLNLVADELDACAANWRERRFRYVAVFLGSSRASSSLPAYIYVWCRSKIGGNQLVRPFATAPIDLGGNCVNQVAVQIEGAQNSVLVELHVGCDSPQSIISHEKRRLHSAVVPPKPPQRTGSGLQCIANNATNPTVTDNNWLILQTEDVAFSSPDQVAN
jgi:hypothetical protein